MKATKTKNNKIKKSRKMGRVDLKILIPLLILVGFGFLMVYSASAYYSLYHNGSTIAFFKKQMVWVPVGIIAMFGFMIIDYHFWKKVTKLGYLVVAALLVFVLVGPESIVPNVNGATRWIKIIGDQTFQPSELAKYAMVLTSAALIDKYKSKIATTIKYPAVILVLAGIYFILIEKENNLSIATVVLFSAFVMLFVGGLSGKLIAITIPSGMALGVTYILTSDYRRERAFNFTNPWKDAAGAGYQLKHSLMAIGSGGLFGVGLGQSKQKALFMPEPHNDFIFAIIAEELGLIGCIIIIGLFVILILSALSVAVRAKDMYGRLVAVGITTVIGFQVMINILVVTGSMPVTGVPLPFISYGGTSLVVNMAAMGILLNISRQCRSK